MDMCYDGTLVMPSSYVLMDEEEMMYVEGGSKTFVGSSTTLAYKAGKFATYWNRFALGYSVESLVASTCGLAVVAVASLIGSWMCTSIAGMYTEAKGFFNAINDGYCIMNVNTKFGVVTSVTYHR